MSASVTVTAEGGLFEDPDGVVERSEREMIEALGEEAAFRIKRRLDRVLQHPTGHYRRSIGSAFHGADGSVKVHDNGVVYGPWLEGSSRRNHQTRFKGYSTFRKILQEIEEDAEQILGSEVKKLKNGLEA